MKKKTLLKRALKFAVGPSIGVMIGVIITRTIIFPNLYNQTYPPIFIYAVFSFFAAYIGAFLISLLVEWLKIKIGDKQQDIN